MASPSDSRVIVCCDGTWNQPDETEGGEPAETNVLVFSKALIKDARQRVVYLDGVGTADFLDKVVGGGLGVGLSSKVQEAYLELSRAFLPGDDIFIVGFSRGAFTARSLIGFIARCGLLKWHGEEAEMKEEIASLYSGYRQSASPARDQRTAPAPTTKYHSNVRIQFVGVWDTVGALGIPVFGKQFVAKGVIDVAFHDASLSSLVDRAFHAVAIDELRSSFLPALWQLPPDWSTEDREFEQVWFRGAHADVGGGYKDSERGLANVTLHWMAERAKRAGARFDQKLLSSDRYRPNVNDRIHESYGGATKAAVSWSRWAPVSRSKNDPDYSASIGHLHESVFERTGTSDADKYQKQQDRIGGLEIGQTAEVSVRASSHWNWTGVPIRGSETYELIARGILRDGIYSDISAAGRKGDPLEYLLSFTKRVEDANWLELCEVVATEPNILSKNEGLTDWLKLVFWKDPKEFTSLQFRVGESRKIGAGTDCPTKGNGFLWLFVNDAWLDYANNSGELEVTIRRVA